MSKKPESGILVEYAIPVLKDLIQKIEGKKLIIGEFIGTVEILKQLLVERALRETEKEFLFGKETSHEQGK